MPNGHPRIGHFMPYFYGDSLGAIIRAMVLRFFWIDQNLQIDANGVGWIVHWGNALKNKLKWIAVVDSHGRIKHDKKGREIRIRDPRNKVPFRLRSTSEISRLRSARHGGRRLYTVDVHFKFAATQMRRRHRIIVIALESKTVGSVGFWKKTYKSAQRYGAYVVVMRLQSIPYWAQCLSNASSAGFQTAILPRGPKPVSWDATLGKRGVKVWGKWRRK